MSPCFESRVISLMWGRQARDGRRISANIWSACEEPIRMFCIRAVLLDGQWHRNETSHDMRLVLFIHIILEVVVLTRTCTAGGGVTYVSHSWLRRQRVVACCVHIRIYIINYMCFCYFNNFNLISYYNYPLSLCIIDHINNKQHIYILYSRIKHFFIHNIYNHRTDANIYIIYIIYIIYNYIIIIYYIYLYIYIFQSYYILYNIRYTFTVL